MVEIIPANGTLVHTQTGQVTVTVSVSDDDAGVCGADLLDSNDQDVSHLLEIDGQTIQWSADTDGNIQYTLIVYDCAGNSSTVPVSYTTATVPPDVDYGLDANASAEFVGGGIRMTNGNMVQARSDIALTTPNSLGFGFNAFYNSCSTESTALGYGWSHTYADKLTPIVTIDEQPCTRIVDATGRARYFSATNPRIGLFDEKTHLTYDGGYYIWHRLDGSRYYFYGGGRLTWMEDMVGNRLQLAYTNDRLHTITDSASGRMLTLTYDDEYLASITGPVTQAVPNGIWAVFSHDAYHNLETVSYADGSGITYTYGDANDAYNLTRKENYIGHLLAEWSYDSQDRADYSRLTDDSGVSLGYPGADRVTVTDAYGVERTYGLGQILGRQKVVSLEQGPVVAPYNPSQAIAWQYDNQLNLEQVELAGGTDDSPANTIHRFEDFDARGNPGTVIQAWNTPDERIVTFTYHPTLNTVLTRSEASVLDPGQLKETVYDYDNPAATGDDPGIYNQNPGHLLRRIIEKGYTRSDGSLQPYTYISTFTYNARGQVLTVDGPLDGPEDTTENTYDPITGDLTDLTRPLVGTTSYSNFDAAGRPATITDINGIESDITYDGRGRIIETINQANGGQTTRTFDKGLLEQTADADGITHTYEYDSIYGRLATITDQTGDAQIFSYDNQGNRCARYRRNAADPSNYTSERWSFDHPIQPGLLYRAFTPNPEDGAEVYSEYDYDRAGNTISVNDPKNAVTRYDYDAFNRMTEVIQPGSGSTTMTYDAHGNQDTITDAQGHQTIYEYDDMGRLVTLTSPDSGITTYTYDAAGSLVHSVDGRGVAVDYLPDALGRTRRIDYPAMAGRAAYSVTYDYDLGPNGLGRLAAMGDASGSTTWDYSRFDDLGILTKTTTIDSFTYSVSKSTTRAGRVTQEVYPSGRSVDYDRTDCTCSISGVTTTHAGITTTLVANLAYRPFGVPKAMDIGDSGTPNVDNRYDGAGRLTAANPGTPNERSYTHDANGNTTGIQTAANPWQNQQFTYDALNRITGAIGAFGMLDLSYDQVGNRLTHMENGLTDTYSYVPGSNRIDRISSNENSPVQFSYDG
ncbi:MAG: RHS repeat protein, partial [Sulfitobacter sp.]|nr:RHS repeat protein [Sulfitobacter sp.]